MQSLPKEVLLNVFSYLSLKEKISVQRVRKQWLGLSLCDVKRISFISFGEDSSTLTAIRSKNVLFDCDSNIVSSVLKRSHEIQCVAFHSIDFAGDDHEELKQSAPFLSHCKQLQLTCDENSLIDEKITVLTNEMSSLEEVTLAVTSDNGDYLNSLDSIFRNNTRIKVLHLKAFSINFDFSQIPSLNELTLSFVDPDAYSVAFFDSILAKSSRTLQKLDIFDTPFVLFSGDILKKISSFSKLKDFRAKMCFASVPQLELKTLETLKIDVFSTDYDYSALEVMPEYLQFFGRNSGLKVLELNWRGLFTDQFLMNLCDQCPKLKYINLAVCSTDNITSKSLQSLLNLRNLEGLEFGWTSIEDKHMAGFIRCSPSLRVLRFWNVTSTPETLNAFVEKAASKPREKFFLNFHNINEYNFIAIENMYLYRSGRKSDSRDLSILEWKKFAVDPFFN